MGLNSIMILVVSYALLQEFRSPRTRIRRLISESCLDHIVVDHPHFLSCSVTSLFIRVKSKRCCLTFSTHGFLIPTVSPTVTVFFRSSSSWSFSCFFKNTLGCRGVYGIIAAARYYSILLKTAPFPENLCYSKRRERGTK